MEPGAPDNRLTPMEALMWRLEGDRSLSSNFGSITFLDRAPEPETFRRRMIQALDSIPRFRQRIDDSGPPGSGAVWVDVEPDIDHHLRWVAPPGDASEQAVLDMAAELVATPFEPDHPPWEFRLVTGLADGRAALVQRMHHSVTDGEGGVGLAAHFVDFERHPEPAPTPERIRPHAAPAAHESPWLDRLVSNTADRAGNLARTAVDVARWTTGGVSDPSRFARLGSEAAETARSLRRQLLVIDRARSPLWKQRSTRRQLVVGSVRFAPVRAAATEAQVSINDVFVTATLRGVASYHRLKGATVDELRVAIPVSTRTDRADRSATPNGGNAFSPTRATLPSGEAHAAGAHLKAVSGLMSQIKAERALNLVEPLAAVSEIVPTPMLRTTLARQAGTVDYAASNVRTTSGPLYMAGAKMEATYALGPLMNTAANITMLSYDGRLDLGIHVDPVAVSDPELLRDTVVAAIHEICAAFPGATSAD